MPVLAGFTIATAKIPLFQKKITKLINKELKTKDLEACHQR